MRISTGDSSLTIVFVSQIFFILALFILLIWITIKFVKWSFKLFVKSVNLMTGSPVIKLISFSISLYLFTDVTSYAIFTIYRLFKFFFVETPTELLGGMKIIAAQCKATPSTCQWVLAKPFTRHGPPL